MSESLVSPMVRSLQSSQTFFLRVLIGKRSHGNDKVLRLLAPHGKSGIIRWILAETTRDRVLFLGDHVAAYSRDIPCTYRFTPHVFRFTPRKTCSTNPLNSEVKRRGFLQAASFLPRARRRRSRVRLNLRTVNLQLGWLRNLGNNEKSSR